MYAGIRSYIQLSAMTQDTKHELLFTFAKYY